MKDGVIVKVRGLKGRYELTSKYIQAVDGCSFEIREGEILGIAGESGCGKSTLAKLLLGSSMDPSLKHLEGTIRVYGYSIGDISEDKLRKEVRGKKVGYVPQGSMNALNPVRRIKKIAKDTYSEKFGENISEKDIKREVVPHLKSLGLDGERVLELYPFELSGGMQQRVVIGLSTLWNPGFLIVDEPTSALDVTTQKKLARTLLDLREREIVESMIYITHDIPTLRQICDRIAIMYGGKIVEIGNMEDVLFKPMHPYTKALIDSILTTEEDIGAGSKRGISGQPPDLTNPPSGCRFSPRCKKSGQNCEKDEPVLHNVGGRKVACHRVVENE
ncbi:hypothetical protein AKJ65_02090 [candidate division MSBL1 archaeon SCGC-AAA259E19]|uniref:ABC transporter domain-containing protein n=1 Tax=candidate division MSBL1 archaeon SCGC-AAA259E19 TaxID=1698264 RepID=A0A133UM54_9EURY|nr:hypothetical protein AKJ65_02090 [candidate division MSBL1 archaeon SCGC-AAA259E19]